MSKKKDAKSTVAFKSILKVLIITFLVIMLIKLTTYVYDISYAVFRDAPNINNSKQEYIINIENNTSLDNIADVLYINGIITDKTVFKIQAKLSKLMNHIKEGNHTVNSFMTSEEIFDALSKEDSSNDKN